MKTDALIEALSRDIDPAPPKKGRVRFATAAAAGGGLALAMVWLFFGMRADLDQTIGAALAKSMYCLAAVAAAAPLAFVLSRPNTGARRWLLPSLLLGVTSLCVAAGVLIATPPDARINAWLAGGFPECLRIIPLLATPVALTLFLVARSAAPTRLTLAGAAIGGLSGAIAAIAYAWFCPVDSIAYVATWYLAAMLSCAAIGAVAGRWLLRW